MLVYGRLVTNFLEKAKIFNYCFSQQYQPISNDSILPLIPSYYSDKKLRDINFNHDKILGVIQSLDPIEPHGHDCVSVRKLKLSCPSIIKSLLSIFRNCNIVPVNKKVNKQMSMIIAPYPYYLYATKFLKNSFLTLLLNL